MPLRITRRNGNGALTISGRIHYADGTIRRIRQRAQSDQRAIAEEEAAALEARLLRDAWHGERPGRRSFAAAVTSYLKAAPRAEGDKKRLHRILRALGDVSLAEVDQAAVDRVRDRMLAPDAAPATVRRGVVTPIRAVLRHAARRGWCARPDFEVPREGEGRTNFLLPGEAEQLIAAAAPHVQPILIVLLCTGARLAEVLELDWREVDLGAGRATFWQKGRPRRRRLAQLPPRAVAALASLPHREGAVFRWETMRPHIADRLGAVRRDGQALRAAAYADRNREGGGQIKTAWRGAVKRAGLTATGVTPHDLRHSWASWHYAVNRDLLLLKQEGGWHSVTLVERYAHLLPSGQEAAIRAFWGLAAIDSREERRA
jgi:integrase